MLVCVECICSVHGERGTGLAAELSVCVAFVLRLLPEGAAEDSSMGAKNSKGGVSTGKQLPQEKRRIFSSRTAEAGNLKELHTSAQGAFRCM